MPYDILATKASFASTKCGHHESRSPISTEFFGGGDVTFGTALPIFGGGNANFGTALRISGGGDVNFGAALKPKRF